MKNGQNIKNLNSYKYDKKITYTKLKEEGFKEVKYFRKVWSWKKFKFIQIETDTDKVIMQKGNEKYCFEYSNHVSLMIK